MVRFNGTEWVEAANQTDGMLTTTLTSLTSAQLKEVVGDSSFMQFRHVLTVGSSITKVTITADTEGTVGFAPTTNYISAYDCDTKTITCTIKTAGNYQVNYVDAN